MKAAKYDVGGHMCSLFDMEYGILRSGTCMPDSIGIHLISALSSTVAALCSFCVYLH